MLIISNRMAIDAGEGDVLEILESVTVRAVRLPRTTSWQARTYMAR